MIEYHIISISRDGRSMEVVVRGDGASRTYHLRRFFMVSSSGSRDDRDSDDRDDGGGGRDSRDRDSVRDGRGDRDSGSDGRDRGSVSDSRGGDDSDNNKKDKDNKKMKLVWRYKNGENYEDFSSIYPEAVASFPHVDDMVLEIMAAEAECKESSKSSENSAKEFKKCRRQKTAEIRKKYEKSGKINNEEEK